VLELVVLIMGFPSLQKNTILWPFNLRYFLSFACLPVSALRLFRSNLVILDMSFLLNIEFSFLELVIVLDFYVLQWLVSGWCMLLSYKLEKVDEK